MVLSLALFQGLQVEQQKMAINQCVLTPKSVNMKVERQSSTVRDTKVHPVNKRRGSEKGRGRGAGEDAVIKTEGKGRKER